MENFENAKKKVLYMSNAGNPCDYAMWSYMTRDSRYEPSNNRSRVQDMGKPYELQAIKWLREDGWDVEVPSQDFLYEIETQHCKLTGRPDCFISKGEKQNVLADIKSMSERDYNNWRKRGSRVAKPHFVSQLLAYALGAIKEGRAVEYIAVVGINRNTSEYYVELMKFDRYDADSIMKRVERVANEGNKARCNTAAWGGRFCDNCYFRAECPAWSEHGQFDYEPEPELSGKSIEPEDPDFDKAVRQLQEARANIAMWRSIEDTAKDEIDKIMFKSGAKTAYSGSLILELSEVETQRFNLEKFKKAHPELLSDFMQTQSYIKYKVRDTRDERQDVPF